MDRNAYLIHTINRRHDIASFFDDRGGTGAMKRFLVETEIDRLTRDAQELGEDRTVVGVVTYASEGEPLQRLALRAPGGRDGDLPLEWSPKLLWLTEREPDGTDHAFFEQDGDAKAVYTGITLKLDEQTSIDIPLVADRLTPSEAKLPDGYSLTEVSVE